MFMSLCVASVLITNNCVENSACTMQISVPDAPDHILEVHWENGPHKTTLKADLQAGDFEVLSTQMENSHHIKTVRYTLDELHDGSEEVISKEPLKKKLSFRDA